MKRIPLISFSALAAVIILSGCGSEKAKVVVEKDERPSVRVERVSIVPVAQTQNFTGTVEANKVNKISSATPNRIKTIHVEVGDHVKKGQRLVEMNAATLAQQKVQLDNFARDYKRTKELLAVGGASQQQVDQLRTQYEATKASYELLSENTVLLSPIDGVVTQRGYDNGDMTAQNPILTIMQITPVKVLVSVSEQFFPYVKTGMPVVVTADVYGDEKFSGKIKMPYPTIDATSRSFTTEVQVPNSNTRLRPGMFARVTMDFGTFDHALISDRAIIKQVGSNERYVYVVREGKAHHASVTTGRIIGDKIEIISGLNNNDQIVIVGQNHLSNGIDVNIIK